MKNNNLFTIWPILHVQNVRNNQKMIRFVAERKKTKFRPKKPSPSLGYQMAGPLCCLLMIQSWLSNDVCVSGRRVLCYPIIIENRS